MKVLITGVTGYLGGALARRFAEAGHDVRGFVRDPGGWVDRPTRSEAAVGDVTDAASVKRAVAGCDTVLHAAALVKMWVRDRRQFDRVNVQGLGHVIHATREAGARLVYVSSFIALGPTDGQVFDESTPRATTRFSNDYERTKWLADQLVRNLRQDEPLPVRLYPGVVYGPGALTEGNHVVKLLIQHARGSLPGLLGDGGLRQCLAFVDDVTRGALAATERGRPGSGYVLGGENRTAVELFEAFHRASGIPPPRRKIPLALAAWLGRLQRWRAALFGIEPELTDEVVEIYRHEWAFSSRRAEQELGYSITPLEQGIARTVEWLRRRGELGSDSG